MKQVLFADCEHCPLIEARIVRSHHSKRSVRAIVVGEGPGSDEVRLGEVFVGEAGQILREVLAQYGGFDLDDIYFTNATLCLPPRGDEKEPAVEAAVGCCSGRLANELAQFPTHIPVLALGRHAQRALGISENRWEQEQLTGKWALGLVHPAALLYGDGRAKPIHLFEGVKKFSERPHKRRNFNPPYEANISKFIDPYPLPDLNLSLGDRITVDVETVGEWYAPGGRVTECGIYPEKGAPLILTEEYLKRPETQAWLRALFAHHGKEIGGHNFKYDILWLHHLFGVALTVGWDTMSMANCWHEEWYKGLKDNATFFFDAPDYEQTFIKDELAKWVIEEKARRPKGKKTILASEKTYDKVPDDKRRQYLFCDLVYNHHLSYTLEALLRAEDRWEWPYKNHDLVQLNHLCEVEARGIAVDVSRLQEEQATMGASIAAIKKEIVTLSDGVVENPASDAQVRKYLFEYLKRKPGRRTPTGLFSVNAEVLQDYKDVPLVEALLAFRRISKLKNSYVDTIIGRPAEGKKKAKAGCVYPDKWGTMRVHPSINHATVVTHRLSVRKPAAQTLPHKDAEKDMLPNWLAVDTGLEQSGDWGTRIKNCYVPAPGYTFVQVDGTGWEYYTAAAQTLLAGFTDLMCEEIKRGGDPHKYLCETMWGPGYTKANRVLTKNLNFGYGLYLGSPQAICAITGLDLNTVKQAAVWLDENLGTGIRRWQAQLYQQAQDRGYLNVPHFNYQIHFDLITEKNVEEIRKLCVSYINQGIASMIMSRAAMIAAPKLALIGAFVVALVHDSFLAEVPNEWVNQATKIMMEAITLAGNEVTTLVPWRGEAETGKRWGELA